MKDIEKSLSKKIKELSTLLQTSEYGEAKRTFFFFTGFAKQKQ